MKKVMTISIFLMTVMMTHADTETMNGITWIYTVTNGVASVGGGSWDSTAVPTTTSGLITIPSMLGGYAVKSIGPCAFYECSSLTNVVISDGVEKIDECAFFCCRNLHSVSLPQGVRYIAALAFEGCDSLDSITIPNSVTNIGLYAFSGCQSLKSVQIPDSVVQIGARAFYICTALTNVVLSSRLTSLELGVFEDCSNLLNINIPQGIGKIGMGAFSGCKGLREFVIPRCVTNIERRAFNYCAMLEKFEIEDNNDFYMVEDGILYDKNKLTLVACPGGMVGDVSVPIGVHEIGIESFCGCTGVSNIFIPNSVTNIGFSAFDDCIGLKEICIPDSVVSYISGFNGCSNLWSITIPMHMCSKVTIKVSSELTSVDGQSWYGKTVPNLVLTGAGEVKFEAFKLSGGLKSVVIPEGVTSIGREAFAYCDDLERVVIPNSITNIASDAFIHCESLRSVSVPYNVCVSGLDSVFPSSVVQGVTNIAINSGATLIDAGVFGRYVNLQSVVFPSSVTRLCDNVFRDCASLKDVYFEGDAPDMGADVFVGTPRSLVVHVPEGSIGWSDDFSDTLPSAWNGRRIAYASDSGSGGSGSSGGGSSGEGTTASAQVALTVTNVVVHYVLNSIVPEIAVPVSGDTGFVTVVTEITGGAVAVAESWATNYPGFTEKFGSDFSAALTKTSGKRDSQGNALMVWQDYVAGTDPTDENDIFKASITLVDGVPQVSYTPELPEAETAKRKYTTYGKARLQDEEWHVVDGDAANYNFFKVTVEMR